MLKGGEETDETLMQLIDRNGADVLTYLAGQGAVSETQVQSAYGRDGRMTPEAKNDLSDLITKFIFKGGADNIKSVWEKYMPVVEYTVDGQTKHEALGRMNDIVRWHESGGVDTIEPIEGIEGESGDNGQSSQPITAVEQVTLNLTPGAKVHVSEFGETAEVVSLDEDGKNVTIRFEDGNETTTTKDMLQAVEEAYRGHMANNGQNSQPQQPNTATEGQTPTATANAPQEGDNAAADTRTPAQRTYDDMTAKYGEKASHKVDVTLKDRKATLDTKKRALDKAQTDYDDAPIGKEDKAEAALAKAQEEYDNALADYNAWDDVRKLRDQALLAQAEQDEQQRKAELERKRAAETEAQRKQREEYEAEQARRREQAERLRQEDAERLKAQIEKEKQEQSNPQPNEPTAPIEGTKGGRSQLALAREEMADNQEALAMLDDLAPRTLDEVAAMLLGGGKRGVKLLREDFKRHTGYREEEMKHYPFLFASADKGGVTLERLGEMVANEAVNENIPFDEQDAMAGVNAVLDMLSGVYQQADINQYIQNKRIAEAREFYNSVMGEAKARMLDAYGMTEEEYESYMSWLEDAIEQGKSTLSDEEFNQIFNVYEQGQTTDAAGGNQEGAATTERTEGAETDIDTNGERGNGETDAGTGEQAAISKYEEAESAFFGFLEWTNWEYGTNYDWNSLMSFLKWANKKAKAKEQPLRKFVREWIGDKYPPKDATELTDKIFAALKEREEAKKATAQDTAQAITAAEAETDTNPTEGQKEAGNYKKGHVRIDGYDITIEQPKGSIRRGTDKNGRAWDQVMHNTYGYIRGTESVDGDHIDVFLSDDPTQGNVYVVDQVNEDGTFDEHKVMYGFPDMESARQAYLSNYEDGWRGLGTITPVSKEEFKKWIESSHRKTKPFSEYKHVKTEGDVMVGEGITPPTEQTEGTAEGEKSVGGFVSGMSKMQRGRIEKTLNERFRYEDGGVMTRAEHVERLVSGGAVFGRHIDNKGKVVYSIEGEGGIFVPITKTEYDYAVYLGGKVTPEEEIEAERDRARYKELVSKYEYPTPERIDGMIKQRERILNMYNANGTEGRRAQEELAELRELKSLREKMSVRKERQQEQAAEAPEQTPALTDKETATLEKFEALTKRANEIRTEVGQLIGEPTQENYDKATDETKAKVDALLGEYRGLFSDLPKDDFLTLKQKVWAMLGSAQEQYRQNESKENGNALNRWANLDTEINKALREHYGDNNLYMGDMVVPFKGEQGETWEEHVNKAMEAYDKEYAAIEKSDGERLRKEAAGYSDERLLNTYIRNAGISQIFGKGREGMRKFIGEEKNFKAEKLDDVKENNLEAAPDAARQSFVQDVLRAELDRRGIEYKEDYTFAETSEANDWYKKNVEGKTEQPRAAVGEKEEQSGKAVSAVLESTEKIEDFGEKIGMARKDTATKGIKRGVGEMPAWKKKYRRENVTPEELQALQSGKLSFSQLLSSPAHMVQTAFDPTKPFVGFYVEEPKTRWGSIRYYPIKDAERNIVAFNSEAEYEAALPVFEVRDQGYRVVEKDGKYKIVRRASNGKQVEYAEFDTREDAEAYMVTPEGATSLLNRKRENFELPALEGLTRNGMKDWRKGRNITSDDMLQTFGFRGGEFGNWLNAEERQQFLNTAYDALMDLAEALGVSPRALSLGGALSIAFGARGRQGARAHYEPSRAVINLTKMKGAGSLAHEWAHALDNYFGMLKAGKEREHGGENDKWVTSQEWARNSQIRKEIDEIFTEIVNTMKRKTVKRQIDIDKAQADVDKKRASFEREVKAARSDYERGVTKLVYNRKTKEREQQTIKPTEQQLAEFDRIMSEVTQNPQWEWDEKKLGFRLGGELGKQFYELVHDVMPNTKGAYGPANNVFYFADKLAKAEAYLEQAKNGESETVRTKTNFLEGAEKADKGRAGSYYTKGLEMFARAFETYLAYKMAASGRSSDYLTYKKGEVFKSLFGFTPYPEGEELSALTTLFDKLFSTMQEYTDEQGNVMLYERANGKAARVSAKERKLRDAVVDLLRKAGIDVVMESEEGLRVLDMANGRERQHRVYHGSGADFERFDHSHMGEGEGNQAFGWGTYVTEVEGIGKKYANDAVGKDSPYQKVEYVGEKTDTESLSNAKAIAPLFNGGSRDWNGVLEFLEQNKENPRTQRHIEWFKKTRPEDWKSANEGKRILYTVEIPRDNGKNYIDFNAPMISEKLKKAIGDKLKELGFVKIDVGNGRTVYGRGYTRIDLDKSFSSIQDHLGFVLGGGKGVSELLHSAGYVGIKYPADYYNGGNKEGKFNYVIFDDGDLKITNKVKFFRTESGEAYGFTMGGKIYLDPKIATAETPVHEYTHLWAAALREANPKAWEQLKSELEKDRELVAYVRGLYPELAESNGANGANGLSDELAEEVFAHFSGRRGAERLREEQRQAMEGANDYVEKAGVVAMFERLRDAIKRFWSMARDLFAGKTRGVEKLSAEDFADMVLGDLVGGFKPDTTGVVLSDKIKTQRLLDGVAKAANTIKKWIESDATGKSFTIELPQKTKRMIRRAMGRDFDSHNITSDGIRHALDKHGVGGEKITENSIPIRKEDAELIPYIMTAPDYVKRGSTDNTGRESIRFYKTLSNGYVVVVEKEYKNSPDDMETINMWAEKSSRVADARSSERPLRSTSTPANVAQNDAKKAQSEADAVTVITRTDAAKIRKDSEIAIKNDKNVSYQKADSDVRFRGEDEPVFYSNALRAVENIKQERATPEQWVKMIEKQGGMKAGEDKWLGLSEWLNGFNGRNGSNGKTVTLTKQEVLDYIRSNEIQVEEVEYGEDGIKALQDEYDKLVEEKGDKGDAWSAMNTRYMDNHDVYLEDYVANYDGKLEVKKGKEYGFAKLGLPNPINNTRLRYSTKGLNNKREIAFVVPTAEPYEDDEIHFGELGGQAIMWARFGETTDADGKRVLVIDEIQSNRHQEGREKGYKEPNPYSKKELDRLSSIYWDAYWKRSNFEDELNSKYWFELDELKKNSTHAKTITLQDVITKEESEELEQLEKQEEITNRKYRHYANEYKRHTDDTRPAPAPFEKNWHEVAMKRMLRFAAENGYDKVAWTKGEQQAERNGLGAVVSKIEASDWQDLSAFGEEAEDAKSIFALNKDGDEVMQLIVGRDGTILTDVNDQNVGKNLSEYVGKEMAARLLSEGEQTIEGNGLRIGGEGMKGFYDQILPRFMDKYGKKWGVKTGEVRLDGLSGSNGENGVVMHAVDVTDDMRESVMRGQPLFREGEGPQVEYVTYEESLRRSKAEGYTKRQHDAWVRRYWPQRKMDVEQQAERLNLGDRVTVAVNADELEAKGMRLSERDRRSKGWYDRDTGKIVIILQNNTSMDDVAKTLLHEGVGHYGLRYLFGKHFEEFLDLVYAAGDEKIRREIAAIAARSGYNFHDATEEYLSRLAEEEDFERPEQQSWWRQVKMAFFTMLRRIGFKIENWTETITDDELKYVLWRSYQNMKENGAYRDLVEVAEDVAMQAKLKVGAFEEEKRNDKNDRGDRTDRKDGDEWSRAAEEAKRHWPDAVVLERAGDYYEVHGEDARKAAKILGLPLVRKSDGSYTVGFPTKEINTYLPRLVRAGARVAVVDSVKEDAVVYGGEDVEAVNARFNEELQQQIDGTLPKGHVYNLGMPSGVLRSTGFPNVPIELSASHLADKAKAPHHPFSLSKMKGLVNALQEPMAVFAYGDKGKAQNVIVEIQHDGKNFVVGIHFNQKRGSAEVSSIRGLYPKDNHEWLHWIEQGKALYLDKEKIQAIILQQQMISSGAENTPADLGYTDLNLVAKIVKKFENPQILRKENPYRADREDRKNREDPDSDVLFRSEEGDVFFSNAERDVENIMQERATPEQWLKIIEKQGSNKKLPETVRGAYHFLDWMKTVIALA